MTILIDQCLTTGNQISVLRGQHEQVTIEGNTYGLITIGSRRYLIDYQRMKSGIAWYKDNTSHLEYITKASSGTALDSLPANPKCVPFVTANQVKAFSWEDAYNSTIVIRENGGAYNATSNNYAAGYIETLNTDANNRGLRWSLPNYELAMYIVSRLYNQDPNIDLEARDWLYDDTGLGEIINSNGDIYFWLPFSNSVTISWGVYCVPSDEELELGSGYRSSASSRYVALPCTLI